MVNIKVASVLIGGRSYNRDKSGYPLLPTVFSGVDITWGAGSCIEHQEPARAQISLWVPKTHETWIPALGDVVAIKGGNVTAGSIANLSLFAGKVESVKLQDDHKSAAASVIPNSTEMVNLTGWDVSWASDASGPFTNINSFTTISAGKTLTVPFKGAVGSNHIFSIKAPVAPVQGGRNYSFSFESNYAGNETISFTFYSAEGAIVSSGTALAVEKRYSFKAPDSATTVKFEVRTASIPQGYIPNYIVGSFLLGETSGAAAGGYRINVIAADALAEAARLRLSDKIWPMEYLTNRQVRIADLATKSGVRFDAGLSEQQGYYEALNTLVIPRDVDSAPALEVFQRTTMAAGHTVQSVANVVQPANSLKLPLVLSVADTTGLATQYKWLGTAGRSRSTKTVNGIVTRTNEARNPSTIDLTQYYFAVPGTGGVAALGTTSINSRNGTKALRALWSTSSTGGTPGMRYQDTNISGTSGSKVSVGVWMKVSTTVSKTAKLVVTLYNGATPAGTLTSGVLSPKIREWTYVTLSGITATSAYTSVEVAVQMQTNMVANEFITLDGIIIEKTATAGTYFDGDTLDIAANIVSTEKAGIPTFSASAIEDDTFELDTTRVVTEVNVGLKVFVGSVWDPATTPTLDDRDQKFTNELGSRKTTPQSRTIATDWFILDNYDELATKLPTSAMVTKGKLLLAGQSVPQWRLSSSLVPVLKNVPEQESLSTLLSDDSRFGALVKISDAPSMLFPYMRVLAGRIVLGDHPRLEFELEPVEYSAPLPMSKTTLTADDVASNFRIGNFHTLTANNLRKISAR